MPLMAADAAAPDFADFAPPTLPAPLRYAAAAMPLMPLAGQLP